MLQRCRYRKSATLFDHLVGPGKERRRDFAVEFDPLELAARRMVDL